MMDETYFSNSMNSTKFVSSSLPLNIYIIFILCKNVVIFFYKPINVKKKLIEIRYIDFKIRNIDEESFT